MRDSSLQLVHERAAREHRTKQRAKALRSAAIAVASRQPNGPVEREMFDVIVARLRSDAVALESTLG
jgi:hypothetical protein